RLVHVFTDLGKTFDIRHQLVELFDAQSQQLASHEDVLSPGELGVKAHAQFEQGCYPAFDLDGAGAGLGGAGDHLQQGTLAGAVHPYDTECLAGINLTVDVLEDPAQLVSPSAPGQYPLPRAGPVRGLFTIGLADSRDPYASHQGASTTPPARSRNRARPTRDSSTETRTSCHRVCHWGKTPLTKTR